MISNGNFREYYENELRSDLEAIDLERRKINRRIFMIMAATAMLIAGEILLIPDTHETLRGILPMITGMTGLVLTGIFSKNFRNEYKSRIIARITTFVDPELVYSPDGTIPQSEFIRSRIFPLSCDAYKGEDHFTGKIGRTAIEFSEVEAKHRNTSESGASQKDEYITIFRGIFIIADFNKDFKTHTVVLPDTAEKLFGKFGQALQSFSSGRGELVRLENLKFEKEFCVYSDDQVEARYILTPSLMERILAFKEKWKKNIYLSFINSKVYIAISMNKNLFELRPFKPAADYAFLEENLRFLTLLEDIVEDLNLNTRIWTKE